MKTMTIHIRVWRQPDPKVRGKMVTYTVNNVLEDMSFLEMLDVLNEDLTKKGDVPVEFDSDCREGICGCCSLVINGIAHGPEKATASCQLHMRKFKDGDTISIEPWRARAFPMIKDLVVDRNAMDEIIAAGGFVSFNTGGAQDANAILIPKEDADKAMDAAACIGCGACIAACPNASASLFVSAKIAQLAYLPQGHPERKIRALNMIKKMDELGFGDCSNHGECEAVCPKQISIKHIAKMRREYFKASIA